jgi:hypothetical protein
MADAELAKLGAPPAAQPNGYLGTVFEVPEDFTDRLKVTIDSYSTKLPFEAVWDLRSDGVEPSEGDPCLVHLDEQGGAWVDSYWPHA